MVSLLCTLAVLSLISISNTNVTIQERHPASVTVVHWKKYDFSIQKTRRSKMIRWHDYIYSMIKHRFKTRVNMRDIYATLASGHQCLQTFQYSQPFLTDILSMPCHNIAFSTWELCDRWWKVSLHHHLSSSSINVTIIKAFVAYNMDCCDIESFIAVDTSRRYHREGHPGGRSNLATFCGHVNMESMFSKWNEVMIQVKSSVENIKYPASLVASYTAMGRGAAYMWYSDSHSRRLLPNIGNINVSPRRILFVNEVVIAIWYIANDVFVQRDSPKFHAQYQDTTKFRYHQINITLENCTEPSTSLIIYAGLQSWFRMRWKENPVAEIYCNTTDFTINTTSHMYTTVAMKRLYTQGTYSLRCQFKQKWN